MPRPAVAVAFLTLSLAAAARSAAAQAAVPDPAAAAEVRRQFVRDLDSLQAKFVALAEAFPADKYAWRPAPGVRSVGEVFMHVASEYYTFAPAAYGGARSPAVAPGREGFQRFEASAAKPEVLRHLREGPAYARATLGALDSAALAGPRPVFGGRHTVVETSLAVTGDLHEHLGQLIAYARMNGVTPPWSR